MGKNYIFITLSCCVLGCAALADQPAPEPVTIQPKPEVKLAPVQPPPALPQPSANTPELFSLGRSVGSSYFNLITLSEKAGKKSFSDLQQEYSITFQDLNVIDIILDDLDIHGKSRQDLNKLRINFYNALKNQDLNETQIAFVRDMFVIFYENLSQDIKAKYCFEGSWLLSTGFYTAFQLESLKSPEQEKVLLSGFNRILDARPVAVPESIYSSLAAVSALDKISVTQSELARLESNLVKVTEYFTNYPETKPLFSEIKDIVGVWQGILVNPENEKHDIRLIVNEDLTAQIDIPGIAGEMLISDVRVINNYFTFMFKPFGTEKLYLKFDAKLTDEVFTGEITDVLGSKGYWVLAKTDEKTKLSEDKLNKMISYIAWMEKKLKERSTKEIEKKVHLEELGHEAHSDNEDQNIIECANDTDDEAMEAIDSEAEFIEELHELVFAEGGEVIVEANNKPAPTPDKKDIWKRFTGGIKWFFGLFKF